MDPDQEIAIDLTPLVAIRIYKSGRVERLSGTDIVPPSSTSKDITISPTVTARLYLPNNNNVNKKLPILVYFHGGGFLIESPFSPLYHPYTTSLSSHSNLLILSLHYRLAPQHLLPSAYDDAWTALNYVSSPHADPWITTHANANHVFLAGDSAGANIAFHTAMRAGPRIAGMVLVHPYFWGTEPVGSEPREREVRDKYDEVWKVGNREGVSVDDPWLNVWGESAPSLAGLGCGRVMVCVAGEDVLVERGRVYGEKLRESGWEGNVEVLETPGEGHCFHLQKPGSEKAVELMEKMVEFFNSIDFLK